jgi:IS4 transposase
MAVLDEEWELLAGLLPTNWRELARECGAIKRERGITDPAVLLQLLLMHASTGLSLRQTLARAAQQGLATISDVALLKRLRTSGPWLEALTRAMFRDSRFGRHAPKVTVGRRIRLVDATTVEEPGATGTSWRVHFSLRLPDLVCDHYEITDVKGGETYRRFPVERGDVVLGDRGYSNRPGAAHVLARGGDFVVRLNHAAFPLKYAKGGAFLVAEQMGKLKGRKSREWSVVFEHDGVWHPARLCALRKSKVATERAQSSLRKQSGTKRTQLQPDTLALAGYIMVLTSVSADEFSTDEVLELYRARWQVELAFKRMKSLLKLGHVPKKNDASARAWIEAKLLTVLLIERLLEDARAISPWGYLITAA